MKIGQYVLALVVGHIGLLFLLGNQGIVMRVIIGIVLIAAALVIAWMTKAKIADRTIVQKIELSGDVEVEQMKCQSCNAPLEEKSVELHEGGIFVKCPYCGTSYQLEEAPKW